MSEPEPEALGATFEEQGYVVVEGFFDEATVERARRGVERVVDREARRLLEAGAIDDACEDEPFETRMWRIYEQNPEEVPREFREQLHLEEFYDVFFHEGLLDVVESSFAGEIKLNPAYTVRCKYPQREEVEVLWHQDDAYFEDPEQFDMVNVWSPLVPATVENGCMEFVPGTHTLGHVEHEQREHWLEIEPDELDHRVDDAVAIELDPGDVVIFDSMLFHRGLPNRSDGIRWNLDWRYTAADEPSGLPYFEEEGFVARSRSDPSQAVASAEEWADLGLTRTDAD